MKIELADATGCPVPQFIVWPETPEERMLLKAFSHFCNGGVGGEWIFALHGFVHENGVITSFNFGLRKPWPVLDGIMREDRAMGGR